MVPPATLEERIANTLIPAPLYWRIRAYRGLLKGEAELRLLRYLADPAKTSVDAGANKGVYTYFLSRYSRHVYAYEPNPKIFALLARSVKGRNVTARPSALSDVTGEAMLVVPRRKAGYSNQLASLRPDKFTGEAMRIPVATRRLDDEDVGDPGFVKIDVEGFETNVLEGARATLARSRPTLLVEIEEVHTGRPVEDTLGAVQAMGYRGLFLDHGRLVTLARFDPVKNHRAGDPATYVFNFIFLPA